TGVVPTDGLVNGADCEYNFGGMDNHGASQINRSAADEAAPVRRWLTHYFRRRVRNASDIEDMVQDVFTRIAARDSSEPVEHLGGYVLKTAASVLADWARRGSSHRAGLHVAFDSEVHSEPEIDPERILAGKEDLQAATRALLRLPERSRIVFILRRLE